MQGIQFFHYKGLQDYLLKLKQEELFNFPCEHEELIIQHEEKLKEIYHSYQQALNQVSDIISQFDEHKLSIRRLMIHHKQCRRQVKKNENRRVA